MDVLKNKQLLSNDGKYIDSEEVLKDKNLILYFFSASWCSDCVSILQTLHRIYDVIISILLYKTFSMCFFQESKKRKYGLEIIYVSADTELTDFSEDFKKQHGGWYAIPFLDSLAE